MWNNNLQQLNFFIDQQFAKGFRNQNLQQKKTFSTTICKKVFWGHNSQKKIQNNNSCIPRSIMISMDEEPKLAKGMKLFCSPQHPTWPGFISWRSEGADVPDPQDPTILKEGFFFTWLQK